MTASFETTLKPGSASAHNADSGGPSFARLKLSRIGVDGNRSGGGLGETLALGDLLALGETDGDSDDEGDSEGLFDDDGLTDADGETEADGLTDADPVDDSCSARNTPAESPETANVGLLVSPVLVLMRNSPLTYRAAALFRDRAFVIAVKLVDGVICVVELISFANPRRYKRDTLGSALNADDPNPTAALTSEVIGFVVPLVCTSVVPAVTVNFQHVAATSLRLLKLIVKFVPMALFADATKRHTDTQAPSSAAPVGLFVYSPSLVHVPLPPVTDVTSLWSPSVVVLLLSATIKIAWSPAARAAVVVARTRLVAAGVPRIAVPRVPPEAMAIY